MSTTILEFARSFVKGRIGAEEFVNCYQELWEIERDNKRSLDDFDGLSECLSSMFCLADLYNSKVNKEKYELDGDQLKNKIVEVMSKDNFE